MGQLISFLSNRIDKKIINIDDTTEDLIVSSISKINIIKGETIIFCFSLTALKDEKMMKKACKQVVLLKQLGLNCVIVVSDFNEAFTDKSFGKLQSQNLEEMEILIKSRFASKISREISSNNGFSIIISGRDGNLIFAEKSQDNLYNSRKLNIDAVNKPFKINSNLLTEIKNTTAIPIIVPICNDKTGNPCLVNSHIFSSFLAKHLEANRIFFLSEDFKISSKEYVISSYKIERMLATDVINDEDLMLSSSLDALSSGIQYIHLIDIKKTNILTEIAFVTCNGILIYSEENV